MLSCSSAARATTAPSPPLAAAAADGGAAVLVLVGDPLVAPSSASASPPTERTCSRPSTSTPCGRSVAAAAPACCSRALSISSKRSSGARQGETGASEERESTSSTSSVPGGAPGSGAALLERAAAARATSCAARTAEHGGVPGSVGRERQRQRRKHVAVAAAASARRRRVAACRAAARLRGRLRPRQLGACSGAAPSSCTGSAAASSSSPRALAVACSTACARSRLRRRHRRRRSPTSSSEGGASSLLPMPLPALLAASLLLGSRGWRRSPAASLAALRGVGAGVVGLDSLESPPPPSPPQWVGAARSVCAPPWPGHCRRCTAAAALHLGDRAAYALAGWLRLRSAMRQLTSLSCAGTTICEVRSTPRPAEEKGGGRVVEEGGGAGGGGGRSEIDGETDTTRLARLEAQQRLARLAPLGALKLDHLREPRHGARGGDRALVAQREGKRHVAPARDAPDAAEVHLRRLQLEQRDAQRARQAHGLQRRRGRLALGRRATARRRPRARAAARRQSGAACPAAARRAAARRASPSVAARSPGSGPRSAGLLRSPRGTPASRTSTNAAPPASSRTGAHSAKGEAARAGGGGGRGCSYRPLELHIPRSSQRPAGSSASPHTSSSRPESVRRISVCSGTNRAASGSSLVSRKSRGAAVRLRTRKAQCDRSPSRMRMAGEAMKPAALPPSRPPRRPRSPRRHSPSTRSCGPEEAAAVRVGTRHDAAVGIDARHADLLLHGLVAVGCVGCAAVPGRGASALCTAWIVSVCSSGIVPVGASGGLEALSVGSSRRARRRRPSCQR